MKKTIQFILNGEKRIIEVPTNETLLNILRNQVGIKSVKCGCDRGDCGSCTVMIYGKCMRSCLILAPEIEGLEITTLEGLMKSGLTSLQESFIKHNSFQCGFCAPGMILSATELLKKNPKPTKEEIQEALAGNLCRCTGYTPIIDAIIDLTK